MENFIIYNIKAAIILSIFTLVYNGIFKNEKYFSVNRLYLIISVFISYIIPLIRFETNKPSPVNLDMVDSSLREIVIYADRSQPTSSGNSIIGYIYLSGMILVITLFLIKLVKILFLISKNNFTKKDGYYISYNNNTDLSFSFFNRIVIGTKNLSAEEINMIESHELTHVKQKHTIDIFFMELIKIIQWFNPAVYILRNNIAVNHEFTADEKTQNHYKIKTYMELIAKSIKGAPLYPVNSFFNKSLIRKRFEMLTLKKNKRSVIKYIIVTPLLIGLFIFISCSDKDNSIAGNLNTEEFMSYKTPNLEQPSYPEGVYGYVDEHLNVPKGLENVHAKFYYDIYIDETGKIVGCKYKNSRFFDDSEKEKYLDELQESAEKMLLNMPNWEPALYKGKPVKSMTKTMVIAGGTKAWNNLNPPSSTVKHDNGTISTERTEKDFSEVKHLYFNDLMRYISNNIKYPKQAQIDGVEAQVILNITLNKEGKIAGLNVGNINYISKGKNADNIPQLTDKEIRAIDVKSFMSGDFFKENNPDPYEFIMESLKVVQSVKSLPAAEDENGNPVSITFALPIKFKLN